MVDRYHKDIGFPHWFEAPRETIEVLHTKHSTWEACHDKLGELRLWKRLNLRKAELVEIETQGYFVCKYVYRFDYDDRRDVIYVIMPAVPRWKVKTIWSNEKGDNHKTLRRELYKVPGPRPTLSEKFFFV